MSSVSFNFRRVFEDSIDDLPSATAPIDEFNCCDVCKRKDEKFKYAQMYCVVCAKKLCDSHLKVRNAVFCGFFSCPIVDYCSIKYLFALEASFNSCRVCFPSFFFICIEQNLLVNSPITCIKIVLKC